MSILFSKSIKQLLVATVLFSLFSVPSIAQFTQKGQKLDPFFTDLSFGAEFGKSVALSADGKTAIIGAPYDKGDVGAAIIYTLTPCGWEVTKQLTASGVSAGSLQGFSVDISADGNTAIIGAPKTNNWSGAAWVFAKSNGEWKEVKKLNPTDGSGQSEFGTSVALAADGNTAIIGGSEDNNGVGAAWIFRRAGNNWTQPFSKMLGSDIRSTQVYPAHQGIAVDISADGSTAVVGASGQDGRKGAVILYLLGTTSYTEQDLFEGQSGNTMLGHSVAISADGNTALTGIPRVDNGNGGVVVLVRNAGVWSFELNGAQLSNPAKSQQGMAVALSADGNTAIIGGGGTAFTPNTGGQGQTWVMTRVGSNWFEQAKYVGIPSVGNSQQGSAVAISGNGKSFLTAGFADNAKDGAAWFFTTEPLTIPIPSISDFTPKSASEGQTVTITGTDFTCVTEVSFGNVFGEILSQTPTTITANVLGNSSDVSGDVCVYAPGGKDCKGGFTYNGGATSITKSPSSASATVHLYPNPAEDYLVIEVPASMGTSQHATISNALGQTMRGNIPAPSSGQWQVDISTLPAGIYMFTLQFNTTIQTQKFIKK